VRISVSDTGCGISPEFLPFIFDRFRQADSTTTRTHGGLGLGLAIVRHLVELHGGTVQAESAGVGRGATFTILLPLAQPRPSRTPGTGSGFAEDNGHIPLSPVTALDGVNVLLVDDDRDNLQILGTLLTQCRATIQTASSASEALAALEWYKPDVLISDLAMPNEDGYSLIAKARATENGRNIPAIALTAYVRIEDRARAFSAGFNMFVPKPVEPGELVDTIATLTGVAHKYGTRSD